MEPARRWAVAYAVLLAAAGVASMVATPLVAIDHDLWFHLSHGRHLFTEGEIPSGSYFSFLEPAKEGVNYYWLFQALVYAVHIAGGEVGLLVLRGALFALFLLAVGGFLFRGERRGHRLLWAAFLFALFLVHAYPRYQVLRPHSLSYLAIPVFLYLLELRPERILWLPVVALLWVNFHGIEYPVMALVAGAYLAELLLRRWRRQGPPEPGELRRLAAIAATLAAVFLTPHATALLRLPFAATEYISYVIDEMARLPAADYFAYAFSPEAGFTRLTRFNLLLILALLAAFGTAVRRRGRVSHLLLAAGGLVLLTRGVRFTHECALLLLPVLKSEGLVPAELPGWRPRRAVAWLLAALLLAAPVPSLLAEVPVGVGEYPVALHDVPHGIVAFLDRADAGGRVMNNPNDGAYLLWHLHPRYRIAMDLEVAFLFDEGDVFELGSAYFDAGALARFLARYRPEWIAAPIAARGFPGLIAGHPDYRPVFFDGTAVLYADRRRLPEVVAEHELRFLDPHRLPATRFSTLPPEELAGHRRELRRMAEVDPRIAPVNQALAILANLEGRPADALDHVERVIRQDPGLARARAVRGDALTALGAYRRAAAAYRRAVERADEAEERRTIHRSLARCHDLAGRPDDAYRAFFEAIGRFNVEASVPDLYQLGVLAARAGRIDEARRAFGFARSKLPPGEKEWRGRIEEALAALDGGSG